MSSLNKGKSFHFFPMTVEGGMSQVAFLVTRPSPWGAPGVAGTVATRGTDNKAVLTLIYESPFEDFHAAAPITKEEMEHLHLERYRTDWLHRGIPVQGRFERGGEPPDFVVHGPDGPRGLDFTRFAITKRMHSQALFRRFRDEVARLPREDFAHLTGAVIYLWFDDKGFSSLPQRQKDDIDALIAALSEYKFDPELLADQLVEEGGLPQKFDELGTATSGGGAHFYGAPMRGATPSSFFYLNMGFELGLAYQTSHDVDAAWDAIRRLVAKHDNPQTQSLIITVGAPDRQGLTYPSELALMQFALEHDAPELNTEYIERVFVHVWTDGSVIQLHPWVGSIAPPLYHGGFLPAHFSVAPLQTNVDLQVEQVPDDPKSA